LRSYEGGWADKALSASPKAPKGEPKERAQPQVRKTPRAASELDLVEAQIAAAEARVSELEGKLAEDWTDTDGCARRAESAPRPLGAPVRGLGIAVTWTTGGGVVGACTR
jgi:hypothetical protein